MMDIELIDEPSTLDEYRKLIETYKKAIDINEEIRIDDNWPLVMRMITHLTKNHPEILVNTYEYVTYSGYLLDKELMYLMNDNKKIAAIKLYREKTGQSLRDSKNYCDKLFSEKNVDNCI